MIIIKKLEEPQELKRVREEFLQDYLSYFHYDDEKYTKVEKMPDSIKSKYNISAVKELLVKETFGKCAYCESKIMHIAFGDIEHILPKIHRPDLVFEWDNFTLACEQCNRKRKKDYYSISEPLINPYSENPLEFFVAAGPMIMPKLGSHRGYITQQLLELNREELHEKRKEKIEDIQPLLDSWVQADGKHKDVLERALLKYIDPSKEFSFIIKGYYKLQGIPC
ncbi:HNH endonuclease [Bacillus thuringiensis]|nr:HNH endonuclease [Bacillus thuringiensis]